MSVGIIVATVVGFMSFAPIFALSSCIEQKPLRVKQVCGQVLDREHGHGWRGAKLILSSQDGGNRKTQETRANENGEFAFDSLQPGDYKLNVFLGENLLRSQVPIPISVTKSTPGKCRTPIEVSVSFAPEVCAGAALKRRSR